MISKEKIKEHIEKFPGDEIAIEDLIERLLFIDKVEKRIEISIKGENLIEENDLKKEEKF